MDSSTVISPVVSPTVSPVISADDLKFQAALRLAFKGFLADLPEEPEEYFEEDSDSEY